jgi:hypothetical protein
MSTTVGHSEHSAKTKKVTIAPSSKDPLDIMTQAMSNLAQNIGALNEGLAQNISTMNALSNDLVGCNYEQEVPYDEDYDEEYESSDFIGEAQPSQSEHICSNMTQANSSTSAKRSHSNEESDTEGPADKKLKFLEDMNEHADLTEPKGDKININLATNVTKFMRSRPEETKIKELFEELQTPENCAGLEKIIVNENIWARIPQEARSHDLKLQRVQTALIKGTIGVAKAADKLYTNWDMEKQSLSPESFRDIMSEFTRAFRAFGSTNFELCMRRREAMRPSISSDYSHLCAASVPFTNALFGDDVTKVIKEISDDNRLNSKAFNQGRGRGRGGRGYRGFRRGRGRGFGRGRGRARGRGYNSYQSYGYNGYGYNQHNYNDDYQTSKGASKNSKTQTQNQ